MPSSSLEAILWYLIRGHRKNCSDLIASHGIKFFQNPFLNNRKRCATHLKLRRYIQKFYQCFANTKVTFFEVNSWTSTRFIEFTHIIVYYRIMQSDNLAVMSSWIALTWPSGPECNILDQAYERKIYSDFYHGIFYFLEWLKKMHI